MRYEYVSDSLADLLILIPCTTCPSFGIIVSTEFVLIEHRQHYVWFWRWHSFSSVVVINPNDFQGARTDSSEYVGFVGFGRHRQQSQCSKIHLKFSSRTHRWANTRICSTLCVPAKCLRLYFTMHCHLTRLRVHLFHKTKKNMFFRGELRDDIYTRRASSPLFSYEK